MTCDGFTITLRRAKRSQPDRQEPLDHHLTKVAKRLTELKSDLPLSETDSASLTSIESNSNVLINRRGLRLPQQPVQRIAKQSQTCHCPLAM